MTDLSRSTAGLCFSLREAACFSVILFSFTFLAACSSQKFEDLAVNKMPQKQMQETPFLALNADKPGTPVDVQRYLVPGKYTIVDYYSPYSSSGNIEAGLAQLSQMRSDIAVRTVNINRPGVQGVDWESPIVQNDQIGELPYIRIFDPAQNLRAHGRPAYEQVLNWLKNPTN